MTGWETLEFHPLANLFPLLSDEETDALAEQIARLGYFRDQPIMLHGGQILDGRNRYRACLRLQGAGRLQSPPPFEEWRENGATALDWVVSKNLHRRHLTASQRAAVALEVLPLYEEEARRRQLAGVRAILPEGPAPRPREHAAQQFAVSARYVQDARRVAERSPELIRNVRSGELTLPQALAYVREQERPKGRPAAAMPTTRFDVLYADPPWRYAHSLPKAWAIEDHYPTLVPSEIAEMGPAIANLAAPDAILFLWATSPLLPEAIEVMRRWGFTYKTSIVWIKHRGGAGLGYYVRVDHELLLIGAKGNAGPPPTELRFSSVIEEKKGPHAEKPHAARALVEAMYPEANRVELFARERVLGWEAWGNEV